MASGTQVGIWMTETGLRADAQRNRERILSAAEDVFREQGADASLEEVARRAGVGIGTLYRRFPTREALLANAFNDRFLLLSQTSQSRAEKLGPVAALRAYVEALVTNTNVYRSFATSLGTVLQSGTPGCHAMTEEGQRLLRQAQQAQRVRPDFSFDDLIYVATAIALAVERDSKPKSRIGHLLDLFLDGATLR
jgi:AcrR family transcriptional regulator